MAETGVLPIVFLAFANEQDDRVRYLRKLPEEVRRLRRSLETAEARRLCQLELRTNVTLDDIRDVFLSHRDRIAVFHFSGHADQYRMLLEGEAGKSAPINAAAFAEYLAQQSGLQLVVLNACSTGGHVEALQAAGVPVVIATSQEILDEAATEFADQLYKSLSVGTRVDRAFNEAAAAVKSRGGQVMRDLGPDEPAAAPSDQLPWHLYVRPSAEGAAAWSLQTAADDPLFGLPPVPAGLSLPASPYRNLEWFRREDAEIFSGRGVEIAELYRRLTDSDKDPIVLFYGQSGVGKSSVLSAGLLPRLERDQQVLYCRRSRTLGLAMTIANAFGAERPGDIAAAWRTRELQENKPVTVIVDQVEEYFSRPNPDLPDEMDDFLAVLVQIFGDPQQRPEGCLLLSFRKEWLAEIEQRLEDRQLPRSRLFLERLSRDGIVEVIEWPTRVRRLQRHYGLTVAPGLAELIADDLLADRESPVAPMLQILLTGMWANATSASYDRPAFDRALYDAFLSRGLSLDDFLTRQLEALRAEQPACVESGLALDLLTYHTTPLGTAEQRTRADLEAIYLEQAATLPAVIQACRDLYLLVDAATSQPQQAPPTRLTHDTLAPHVRKRFEESDAPGQRARRILESRAVEWADGETGAPLDDTDLRLIEAGQSGMRTWKPDEVRLVEASRAARDGRIAERRQIQEEREESQRQEQEAHDYRIRAEARDLEAAKSARGLRRRAWLLSMVAVVAALLAITGLWLWNVADSARFQEAVARTRADSERDKAEVARGEAVDARATAVTNEQSARVAQANASYAAYISTARRFYDAGQITQMKDALRTAATGSDVGDLRGFEWRFLLGLLRPERLTLAHEQGQRMFTPPFKGVGRVDISPDGRLLADLSDDGTVVVRDSFTGETRRSFVPHEYGAAQLMFLPHAPPTLLTVGASDGKIRFWDAESGRQVRELSTGGASASGSGHLGTPFSASLSTDGRTLALTIQPGQGPVDGSSSTLMYLSWQVHIVDLDTGAVTNVKRLVESRQGQFSSSDARTSAISPKGDRVAIGDGTTVVIRDRTSEETVQTIKLTQGYAGTLAFSPDGNRLAIAGADVQVWDVNTPRQLTRLADHRGPIAALAFSSDGAMLATAGADNTIFMWDAQSFARIGTVRHHEQTINAIRFSADGAELVSASADGTTRIWDVSAGLRTYIAKANSFVFSPDGSRMFAWDDTYIDGRILDNGMDRFGHVIGLTDWRFSVQTERFENYQDVIYSVDGRSLLMSPKVTIYDAGTLRPVTRLEGDTVAVFGAGDRIVTSTANELLVYRTADWQLDRRIPSAKGKIGMIAAQPKSNIIAIASSTGAIDLWDTTTWTVTHTLQPGVPAPTQAARPVDRQTEDGPITGLRLSPNGEVLVAVRSDDTATAWATTTGEKLFDLADVGGNAERSGRPIVSFSPNSQWLAIDDSTRLKPRVWNARTGQPQATLIGHTDRVNAISIAPDGRTVATGSNDSTIKLWNLATGLELMTLETGSEPVLSVGFSPDGSTLVSGQRGDEYRTVKVWRARSDAEGLIDAVEIADPGQARAMAEMARTGDTRGLDQAESAFRQAHLEAASVRLPPAEQVVVALLMRQATATALGGDFATTRTLLDRLVQMQPIGTLSTDDQIRLYFSSIYDGALARAESLLDKGQDNPVRLAEVDRLIGEPIRLGLLRGNTNNLLNVYHGLADIETGKQNAQAAATWMLRYVQAGEWKHEPGEPLKLGESRTLSMAQGIVYYLPFQANAGDNLTLQAISQEKKIGLDPLIVLLGPNDVPLSSNDDISEKDRNAAIRDFAVGETGTYTLVVTHAGGGADGTLAASVTRAQAPGR